MIDNAPGAADRIGGRFFVCLKKTSVVWQHLANVAHRLISLKRFNAVVIPADYQKPVVMALEQRGIVEVTEKMFLQARIDLFYHFPE